MMNGLNKFFFSFLLLSFLGCTQKEGFYLYDIASPNGDKCLTFAGEFDSNGLLKNNRIYLLGFNTGQLNESPKENFVSIKHFSTEMDVVRIGWGDTIYVGDTDAFENKLTTETIIFKERIKVEELNSNLNWKNYDLQKIYQKKYPACK